MKLRLLLAGTRFTVYALDLADTPDEADCLALQFLAELGRSDPAAERSMVAVINFHAQAGPIRNLRKSRELRDGVFEFKTAQGARMLWFYAPNQRTILVHGFKKGANVDAEIDRVLRLRSQWEEQAHG
jgi:hypothetical protein